MDALTAALEQRKRETIATFRHDPLAFVNYCMPWREPGTSLADNDGPDDWQVRVMRSISEGLKTSPGAVRVAVASGHGIGKSALVAWLILWSLATCRDTRGVVTANTQTQLKTKTWAELAKWYALFNARDDFTMESTSIHAADRRYEKTWRVDMIPWSSHNSEAFAGLHNQGRRIILIFDEASAIENTIWEVAEGAMTDIDTEMIWLVFGNPTRNTGRFAECFGKYRNIWTHFNIDSRTARMTNKAQIAEWVETYGEDSDFVKVRVRGMFPNASSMQMISGASADAAFERSRDVREADIAHRPRVLGVDVARYGDDRSVIFMRQGIYAKVLWHGVGFDNMQLASIIADRWDKTNAAACFIDEGYGVGVIDRLRQMGRDPISVNFGSKPLDARYANKGTEMWNLMKEWIATGAIDRRDASERDVSNDIKDDMIGREYCFTSSQRMMLERKEDMKKRGLASPDFADALALTFAEPIRSNVTSPIGSMIKANIRRSADFRQKW